MYDELVKSLRLRAALWEKMYDEDNVLKKAADVIEQLSNAGSAYGRGWTLGYDAGREESKPRWIPVSERLPELNENVLVYSAHSGLIRIGANIWFDRNETHWMPLPEPPKEE